jgi:raffinose/stachyose/melibiose transport system permease protein
VNKRVSNGLQQVVFLGPSFVFFMVVLLIPFAIGIYYSFTEWDGISSQPKWIGLANIRNILMSDDNFKNAFIFTVRYAIVNVLLINMVGFLLALLLTRALKWKQIYRTFYFLPNVIGGLLLGYIFQFIFTRGMPSLGTWLGIGFLQVPWLGTPATAFWGAIIMGIWQSAGYMMMIYIAGIINIPTELIEAARMDGAGGWRVIKNITIPLLMPSFTVCLFLTISGSFKAFDQILSLTGGGPYKSTEVVALDIYNEAFGRSHMGLGSAKAIIFFIIIATITLIQVWLTKRKEVEA